MSAWVFTHLIVAFSESRAITRDERWCQLRLVHDSLVALAGWDRTIPITPFDSNASSPLVMWANERQLKRVRISICVEK